MFQLDLAAFDIVMAAILQGVETSDNADTIRGFLKQYAWSLYRAAPMPSPAISVVSQGEVEGGGVALRLNVYEILGAPATATGVVIYPDFPRLFSDEEIVAFAEAVDDNLSAWY